MAERREVAKQRTRAGIIEAGIRLMHAQGYDATTTAQIAHEAGVSPATLFNYFPTKAAIVFADDGLWRLPPGPSAPGRTPVETVAALAMAAVDQPAWTHPADDPLTVLRFDLVRREPALAQAQVARGFAQVPQLAGALRTAHPDLTQARALALAGAAVGAIMATLTWTAGSDIRHQVRDALDSIR